MISEKNSLLLQLEERKAHQDKEYRLLSDDYVYLKNNYEAEKEYSAKEMLRVKEECEDRIKKTQEELEKNYELKLAKRIQEVTEEAEDRVKFFKDQNDQLA